MKRFRRFKVLALAGALALLIAACGGGGGGGDNSNNNSTPPPASGSLDQSFGSGGKVITSFGPDETRAEAVTIQSNGRIVAAGSYGEEFALARYKTDGTLDTTFGTGGKVSTAIGASGGNIVAVAVQSDGKIVAAGSARNGSGYSDFALARYNADGSLDTAFGTDGKVLTDITAGDQDWINAVAIQSDGKIVAAGQAYSGSDYYDIALARYNTDGSLDTAFGTGGIVITHTGNEGLRAVALLSNGKIVAVGGNVDVEFALVRYNTDGSLDTAFGTNGIAAKSVSGDGGQAYGMALQSDGKMVVAGYANNGGGSNDFALVRFNADGTVDTAFGTDGVAIATVGSNGSQAKAVALQSNGKIVAAGSVYDGSNYDLALVRFNANGTLDTAFGSGGKVTTAVGAEDDNIAAMIIQSDGKIVAAGGTYNGAYDEFMLARYHP